jgi:salicylate hydroxylase
LLTYICEEDVERRWREVEIESQRNSGASGANVRAVL